MECKVECNQDKEPESVFKHACVPTATCGYIGPKGPPGFAGKPAGPPAPGLHREMVPNGLPQCGF